MPALCVRGVVASLRFPGILWLCHCLHKLLSEMSERPYPIGPFYETKSIEMFPAEIDGLVKVYTEDTDRTRQFLGGGFDPGLGIVTGNFGEHFGVVRAQSRENGGELRMHTGIQHFIGDQICPNIPKAVVCFNRR